MDRASKTIAALAAASLAVAACSSSPAGTSTTSTTEAATTATSTTAAVTTAGGAMASAERPAAEIPVFADDGEAIPLDGAVVTGTLDNGLTYYLRENDRPGLRAQLRLAVRAGSVEEGEGQSGAAHYVEHMLFNGTEKYPSNELIAVLQAFGSEFGPDINAYTNWEETVYELTLPTDREDLLATGLDVLREWATAALIDPAEVDLERGVLVEEWRLRSQGFWGRYFEEAARRLLAGTPYEGQNTLASPETVAATTAGALRAFYDDWYRPDNLAIVAVGDFDAAEVEAMIVDTFGGVPGREGPAQPDLATAPAEEPSFLVLADPEATQSFVELNYPLPALPAGTVGSLRQEMAYGLGWDVLVTRLGEDVLRGTAPFYEATYAANPFVRTQRTAGLFAFADPDGLAPTAEALLTEVERVLVHGFTQEELDRAVADRRSAVDLELQQSATTQDADYADRYVEHYLGGAAVPDAETAAGLQHRLLDEMTLDQVTATFRASIQATHPLVIVAGPEDRADAIPSEAALAALVERVRTAAIPTRDDAAEAIETLLEPPGEAPMPEVGTLRGTTLEVRTFGNGARLVVRPTPIVENAVVLGATSFGGWSVLPDGDAAEAQLGPQMILQSGVGDIDQLSLERYLRDREVQIFPYIDETTEGFWGAADAADLETLFQLLHLYMTEPRLTPVGESVTLEGLRPYAADPSATPQLAASLALADARFGGDPRFAPVPTLDDLDTFDAGRALEVFRDRFADAGDFVFVVAGDVDPVEVLALARTYLGTLPSSGGGEAYADVRPERPAGVEQRVVEAGTGEFGEVLLLWDVALPLDGTTRVQAGLLDLVIRQRLTERIREQLSATYSPATSVRVVEDPVPSLELSITISADPADLDRVAAEVLADLADLVADGPTATQVSTAQEQRLRDLELTSNEQLVDLVTFYLLRPGEDTEDIFVEADRVAAATAADLQALAAMLVDPADYIRIDLVPEG
ncbi:MAG: insulinase family protein [Actinobacteria bacterium]|nr:insulinase family protein [Actinomycetota bacterium]